MANKVDFKGIVIKSKEKFNPTTMQEGYIYLIANNEIPYTQEEKQEIFNYINEYVAKEFKKITITKENDSGLFSYTKDGEKFSIQSAYEPDGITILLTENKLTINETFKERLVTDISTELKAKFNVTVFEQTFNKKVEDLRNEINDSLNDYITEIKIDNVIQNKEGKSVNIKLDKLNEKFINKGIVNLEKTATIEQIINSDKFFFKATNGLNVLNNKNLRDSLVYLYKFPKHEGLTNNLIIALQKDRFYLVDVIANGTKITTYELAKDVDLIKTKSLGETPELIKNNINENQVILISKGGNNADLPYNSFKGFIIQNIIKAVQNEHLGEEIDLLQNLAFDDKGDLYINVRKNNDVNIINWNKIINKTSLDTILNNYLTKETELAGLKLKDNITINQIQEKLFLVSETKNGLMSKEDKVKLDTLNETLGENAGDSLAKLKELLDLLNSNSQAGNIIDQLQNGVVKVTGDQDVDGVKTFIKSPVVPEINLEEEQPTNKVVGSKNIKEQLNKYVEINNNKNNMLYVSKNQTVEYTKEIVNNTIVQRNEKGTINIPKAQDNSNPINKEEFDEFKDHVQKAEKNYFSYEYSEILSMKNKKELIPGRVYEINNYITFYGYTSGNIIAEDGTEEQFLNPTVNFSLNNVEKLVIVANSKDSFFPYAHSLKYPNDIIKYYLDISDMEKYLYDFYSESENQHGNEGLIYYRQDERGNEAYYDFRAIKTPTVEVDFESIPTFAEYKAMSPEERFKIVNYNFKVSPSPLTEPIKNVEVHRRMVFKMTNNDHQKPSTYLLIPTDIYNLDNIINSLSDKPKFEEIKKHFSIIFTGNENLNNYAYIKKFIPIEGRTPIYNINGKKYVSLTSDVIRPSEDIKLNVKYNTEENVVTIKKTELLIPFKGDIVYQDLFDENSYRNKVTYNSEYELASTCLNTVNFSVSEIRPKICYGLFKNSFDNVALNSERFLIENASNFIFKNCRNVFTTMFYNDEYEPVNVYNTYIENQSNIFLKAVQNVSIINRPRYLVKAFRLDKNGQFETEENKYMNFKNFVIFNEVFNSTFDGCFFHNTSIMGLGLKFTNTKLSNVHIRTNNLQLHGCEFNICSMFNIEKTAINYSNFKEVYFEAIKNCNFNNLNIEKQSLLKNLNYTKLNLETNKTSNYILNNIRNAEARFIDNQFNIIFEKYNFEKNKIDFMKVEKVENTNPLLVNLQYKNKI